MSDRAAPSAEPSTPTRYAPGTAGAVRAGAVVLTMTVGLAGANYLFQVLAARWMGPDAFGALAALLAVILVIGFPFAAVQLAVTREVAKGIAVDQRHEGSAFARQALVLVTLTGLAVGLITIVFSGPIAAALQVDARLPVVLTGLTLVFAVMLPAALGIVQGEQRYGAYGVGPLAGGLGRLALLVAVAGLASVTLNAALGATLIGAALAVGIVVWQGRRALRAASGGIAAILRAWARPARMVLPAAIGLLGVASLTNIDIVVIKGALSSTDAGVFGAAGVVAKVALFVPVAIVAVLQPRVAARHATGRSAEHILARSMLVTIVFCVLFTAVCFAASDLIVDVLFGSQFEEAASILGLYAVFISLMSVANIQVNFYLSRGDHRYAYMLGVAAAIQAVALVLFHDTLWQVLYVNLAVAVAVLIAHEVFVQRSGPGLWRAARDLVAKLRRGPSDQQVPA